MEHTIYLAKSYEFGTDGLPQTLKDYTPANGDLILNYAAGNEKLFVQNTSGNVVSLIPESNCSCPYTKEELDKKFSDMQSLIDTLTQTLDEYINGKDVEPSTIVTDYQGDGTTFIYSTPINFKNMSFEAEIDVSSCLTTDENENIISIGSNINLWGTNTDGSGNVIHIYYSRSSYTMIVWTFNGHTQTTKTTKVLAETSDGTSTSTPVDILNIKINSTGLYINDIQYATSDNILNILSLTNISIGSQEGQTRSYAKYNYIRTVLNDTTESTETT